MPSLLKFVIQLIEQDIEVEAAFAENQSREVFESSLRRSLSHGFKKLRILPSCDSGAGFEV